MKADKESELINKYKHLLNPDFVSWKDGLGFIQVGDGWTHIVESLLEAIDGYQKSVTTQLGWKDNEKTQNWTVQYSTPVEVSISTIKEKFSGLNVYFSANEEHKKWIEGAVNTSARIAAKTCECCGTVDTNLVGMTSGWVTVICKPCYDVRSAEYSNDWAERNVWMSKEEARKRFTGLFHI